MLNRRKMYLSFFKRFFFPLFKDTFNDLAENKGKSSQSSNKIVLKNHQKLKQSTNKLVIFWNFFYDTVLNILANIINSCMNVEKYKKRVSFYTWLSGKRWLTETGTWIREEEQISTQIKMSFNTFSGLLHCLEAAPYKFGAFEKPHALVVSVRDSDGGETESPTGRRQTKSLFSTTAG